MPLVQGSCQRSSAAILIVLSLVACKRDLPKDVKYLSITADLPPGMDLMIERHFSSFSLGIICSGLNESSPNLTPLYEKLPTSIRRQRGHVTLPLAWDERSLCKWSYLGTDVKLLSDNDVLTPLMMPISDRHFEEYGAADTNLSGCANIVEVNCIRCRDYPGPSCSSRFRRAEPPCEGETHRRNLQLTFKVALAPGIVAEFERCRELYKFHPTDRRWDLWPFTKTDEGDIVRVDAAGKPLDAGSAKDGGDDVSRPSTNTPDMLDAGPRDAGLSDSNSSDSGSSK